MCLAHREKRLKGARERLLVDTAEALRLDKTEIRAEKAVRQITTRAYAAGEAAMEPTRQQSLRFLLCEGLVVTAETEAAEEAQHLVRSVFGILNLQMADFRAPAATEPTASSWSITEEAIFWHITVQSWKTA